MQTVLKTLIEQVGLFQLGTMSVSIAAVRPGSSNQQTYLDQNAKKHTDISATKRKSQLQVQTKSAQVTFMGKLSQTAEYFPQALTCSAKI